jgi:hypothetical protein
MGTWLDAGHWADLRVRSLTPSLGLAGWHDRMLAGHDLHVRSHFATVVKRRDGMHRGCVRLRLMNGDVSIACASWEAMYWPDSGARPVPVTWHVRSLKTRSRTSLYSTGLCVAGLKEDMWRSSVRQDSRWLDARVRPVAASGQAPVEQRLYSLPGSINRKGLAPRHLSWLFWHPCELSILVVTHLSCLSVNSKWDWVIPNVFCLSDCI